MGHGGRGRGRVEPTGSAQPDRIGFSFFFLFFFESISSAKTIPENI
jgi:hypothetical protein